MKYTWEPDFMLSNDSTDIEIGPIGADGKVASDETGYQHAFQVGANSLERDVAIFNG